MKRAAAALLLVVIAACILCTGAGTIVAVVTGGTGLSSVAVHQVLVGTATNVYTAKTVPDCQDTGGNHLNFTQSSNTFTCGTSASTTIFPDIKIIVFCDNINGTAGTGVTILTTTACTPRAGTNNKDAFYGPFTTSDSVTMKFHLPKDWHTGTAPALSVDLASTDTTSGHTVILQAASACAKLDGTTTDDVAFNTAQSLGTVTLNTTANQTWTATLNAITTTGCSAPGIMWIKITRTTDTATNVELYQAAITTPRDLTMQAN